MSHRHRASSALLVLLAAGLLTACAADAGTPPAVDDDPLPIDTDTAPVVASWAPDADPVDLGGGHTIGDCEGDVPALCVLDGDEVVVGLLEAFRYPAPSEVLERSEADPDAALREFAAARVAEVEQDRLVSCGQDHRVVPDAPGTLTVDGSPGLRYGFVTMAGDVVVEHVVTWATVRDGELRLVVAHAATSDGCMASELTTFPTDELVVLLPALDRVMAGTPLPT